MAVSIGELLGEVRRHVEALDPADGDQAMAALVGLAPIGRALDHLYWSPVPEERNARPPQATALAHACHEIARGWPAGTGRVADLLGATADTLGRNARSFTDEQRWALSESLAETARRCADVAERFPPYARVSQLSAVRDAAVGCERHATRLPADAADRTVLDHLIPARHTTAGPAERIVDAAAALQQAVAGGRRWRRLTMAEMVITINAAQVVSEHAASALAADRTASGPAMSNESPQLAAPAAWRAARAYCASFDDGTKLRPPDSSPVVSAAAWLGRTVIEHLGPAAAPSAVVEPRVVQALQTVTELLPDIANTLDRATWAWIGDQRIWAPERRLRSFEDRNDTATPSRAAVRASMEDLAPLSDSLRSAEALSTALAVELARHAPARLAYLSATHAASRDSDLDLSSYAESARDGARHAQALHPTEWAQPTRPRSVVDDSLQRARAAVKRAGRSQPRTETPAHQRHDDRHIDHAWEVGR